MQLVATIGTAPYKEANYYLETAPESTCRTCYGPVATAELVGGVTDALILLTQEAEQIHWVPLREQLEAHNIRAQKLNIPLGRSEAEIWQVVSVLSDHIEKGSEIVVDITYAFRHLPVLMLTALAYLTAERGVKVHGVYYGAYEARSGDRVPIFDLTPFLTLIDCYHAMRQFRETGDARRLAAHLKQLNASLWKQHLGSEDFSDLVGSLGRLSAALVTALPMEVGLHSRNCLRQLESARRHIAARDVIAQSLIEALVPLLRQFALEESIRRKRDVALDITELRRQLHAIQFALNAQAPDRALVVLREWIVSRCLLAENTSTSWLDYSATRERMSRTLAAISERVRADKSSVSESQRKLSALWEAIATRRNRFAHAGMNADNELRPESESETISKFIAQCEQCCDDDGNWRVGFSAAEFTVLVTPLGLSPGVLYTALTASPADHVLVLSSREAAGRIPEICEKAGFDPSRLRTELVEDPHRCFLAADELVPRARPMLLRSTQVTVNVTGGTTALQYVAERIGREAERLGVRVRRIALVDTRPYDEQKENPYVAGDVVVLDGSEARNVSRLPESL